MPVESKGELVRGWKRPRTVLSVVVGLAILTLGLPATPAAAAPTPSSPITYVYDELGRLEAVVDPSASTNGIAKYAYDDVGNVTSISRQSATATTILDFHPKSGEVGSAVTIYGAAFSSTPSQNTVKFNGTTATVTSATTTRLVATVPTAATSGTISVTSPAGSATSSQSFTVTGSKTPTVTGISPTKAVSGDAVTITGTNFDTTSAASNAVLINDLRAQVTAITATSLTITVPPSATSGAVVVRTLNGAATSASDLTVPPSGYTTTDIESTSRASLGQAKTATVSTSGKVAQVLFDASQDQQVFLDISS